MYETFPHTADLGLRVRAATREELFQEAASGLFSMLVLNPGAVEPSEESRIEIPADEIDFQLFDWLTELLYRFDSQHLLLSEFDVRFIDGGLIGLCRGERLDPSRHDMDHEVKAITYHGLKVEQAGVLWHAEIIVDI